MVSAWRTHAGRGAGALALAALLGTAAPAQADHADRLLGFMAGGAVGGALGSLIGDGSGRELAIGIGTTLGAAYGYEAARKAHRAHPGERWRKQRWRHAERRHHRFHAPLRWVPPVVIERHWAPAPVWRERVVVEPLRTRVVQTVVEPVAAPRQSGMRARYAAGRLAPPPRTAAECRTLEDGPLPVYACTDGSGDWWVLD